MRWPISTEDVLFDVVDWHGKRHLAMCHLEHEIFLLFAEGCTYLFLRYHGCAMVWIDDTITNIKHVLFDLLCEDVGVVKAKDARSSYQCQSRATDLSPNVADSPVFLCLLNPE